MYARVRCGRGHASIARRLSLQDAPSNSNSASRSYVSTLKSLRCMYMSVASYMGIVRTKSPGRAKIPTSQMLRVAFVRSHRGGRLFLTVDECAR